MDSSALRFLTPSALEAKRKLEEEEEMDQKGEEGEGAADEGGDGLGGRAEGLYCVLFPLCLYGRLHAAMVASMSWQRMLRYL